METLYWIIIGAVVVIYFAIGVRIVRPTEKGLIEFLGKYHSFAGPGFHWLAFPFFKMIKVNMTEMMVDADPQEIITKDKLNATVDAQVYFKVKSDEASVKASQYNVYDYQEQIVQLARTTLRNIIGTMSLNDANSKRDAINKSLMSTLSAETKTWGIYVVRTELKEINPPKDVQETMNKVVKAENEKQAAIDFATANETEADGERRRAIKIAEGNAKAVTIEATAKAEAIKKVNEAAEKYFTGNAQKLRALETMEVALKDNTKILITDKGISPNLIIGDLFKDSETHAHAHKTYHAKHPEPDVEEN
ncbi:MAG TPA: SPFH domain-containing protein [Alphaproteobacteria bacterium]|nr:SPFH domain-containing protein [Alphaproteobacteria bacterium]